MGIAVDYNVHRASVDMAKGFRQIGKGMDSWSDGNPDRAADHLAKALNDFAVAIDHVAKAANDSRADAGRDLDKGNAELQKCLDALADGKADAAKRHYGDAVKSYDKALDAIGAD